MNDPDWIWPSWKFGMKRDDLFTTLHNRYNTVTLPLQDPQAFHHDVYEVSRDAETPEQLHRLLAERQQQRLGELNESLETLAVEIIANPKLMGSDGWQYAVQLFRTKSFDSIIRYFASYLPDGYLGSQHSHPLALHRPSRPKAESEKLSAGAGDGGVNKQAPSSSLPGDDNEAGWNRSQTGFSIRTPSNLEPRTPACLPSVEDEPTSTASVGAWQKGHLEAAEATKSPTSPGFLPGNVGAGFSESRIARRQCGSYDDDDDDDDDNDMSQSDGCDTECDTAFTSLCDSTDYQSSVGSLTEDADNKSRPRLILFAEGVSGPDSDDYDSLSTSQSPVEGWHCLDASGITCKGSGSKGKPFLRQRTSVSLSKAVFQPVTLRRHSCAGKRPGRRKQRHLYGAAGNWSRQMRRKC